jgi:hypothetical protein
MKARPLALIIALALPACEAMAQAVPSMNRSGTIASGNIFQTVLSPASTTRKGCTIQNPPDATETLYVDVTDTTNPTPTKARSYQLTPGGTFSCGQAGVIVGDVIYLTAATTGHAFVETDQ